MIKSNEMIIYNKITKMGSSFSCDSRRIYPEKLNNEGYRSIGKNEKVRRSATISGCIIIEEKNNDNGKRQI
jgi:hypothetical protein